MTEKMFSLEPFAVLGGGRWRMGSSAAARPRRRFPFRVLVLAAAFFGATFGLASADDQIVRAANASIAPAIGGPADWRGGLRFETSAHRAWYNVFWSGTCGELPFFERMMCVKGRPTWSEVTKMVLAKAPNDARVTLKDELVHLGRRIGFEWARTNDERRIDNDDLERWSEWLKKDADVNGAVERLAKAVDRRLRPEKSHE